MAQPPRFNEKTFQEWRDHPLTQPFLRFLRDQQEELGRRWSRGQPLTPEYQARAMISGELADLKWSEYANFYQEDDASEQSAEA